MFDSVWYSNLLRPPFTPPSWVFAPAWTFLYGTIFVSFIIYFFTKAENKKLGYFYFFVQMFLNLIWSPIFFYYKNMLLAFTVIILLDIFVFLTIRSFYKVSKISGIILIPYLLWIFFATYLNAGYVWLNRLS